MRKSSGFSLVVIISVLAAAPAFSGSAALEAKYRALAQSAAAKNAQWGVYVMDAGSGKVLLAHNHESRLIPASTLKLFSTAAALSRLGPNYRFQTRVGASREVSRGTLNGDIVIVGGGDPSLGSTVISGAPDTSSVINSWADSIAKAGVRSVKGGVVADVSLFEGLAVPGSWPYEDLGNYYAAAPTALAINDNLYRIVFKNASLPWHQVAVLRLEPPVKGLSWVNSMQSGPVASGDNGFIYRAPRQYEMELRGTIPAGDGEFAIKGSMPDAALFAAQRLREALMLRGVQVAGDASVSATPVPVKTVLARTDSFPLKDIVFATNKRSFNFYAEMLLRALAVKDGQKGSEQNGLASLRAFASKAGIDPAALKLADGCGLSKNNLVTAQAMAQLLRYMRKSPNFEVFRNSLPAPASDRFASGHIKNFGKKTIIDGKIWLKSGSLSGVRSYAGYLGSRTGRLLVFAFIINGYSASGDEIDDLHEKLALACYND